MDVEAIIGTWNRMVIEDALEGGPGSGHHGHAGIPGHLGGSAPGKGGGGVKGSWNIGDVNSNLLSSLKDYAKKSENLLNERIVIAKLNTGEILSDYEQKLTLTKELTYEPLPGSGFSNADIVDKTGKPQEESSILHIHTHPENQTFSEGDWHILTRSAIGEMRVVTPDGTIYRLEKTPEWNTKNWKERTPKAIGDAYNKILGKVEEDFKDIPYSNEFVQKVLHETSQRLAKEFSVKYLKESEIPKKEALLLEGGPGSGHFGHTGGKGGPGQKGGSTSTGRTATPFAKALRTGAKRGMNAHEALALVAVSKAPSAELAKAVLRTDGVFKEITFRTEKDPEPGERDAWYARDRKTNEIVMTSSFFNKASDDELASIVVHEAMHGRVDKMVPGDLTLGEEGPKGRVYKERLDHYIGDKKTDPNLRDLMKQYRYALVKERVPMEDWGNPMSDTFGSARGPFRGKFPYGYGTFGEYISEGFTNPKFQARLNGIRYRTGVGRVTTLWKSFTSSVRRILGMTPKQGSLLDSFFRTSSKMLYRGEAERMEGGPGSGHFGHGGGEGGPGNPGGSTSEGNYFRVGEGHPPGVSFTDIETIRPSLEKNGRYEYKNEGNNIRYIYIAHHKDAMDLKDWNPEQEFERIFELDSYMRNFLSENKNLVKLVDEDGSSMVDNVDTKMSYNYIFTNDKTYLGAGSGGVGSAKIFSNPYSLTKDRYLDQAGKDSRFGLDPAYVHFHEMHHGLGSGTELDKFSDLITADYHLARKTPGMEPAVGDFIMRDFWWGRNTKGGKYGTSRKKAREILTFLEKKHPGCVSKAFTDYGYSKEEADNFLSEAKSWKTLSNKKK